MYDPLTQPLSRVAARMLSRAHRECAHQQFEAAEYALAKVLALAPGNREALRLLGTVAQVRGDHAKAIECFRKLIAASPDDFALHGALGISLYQCGDANGALRHLRGACDLAPSSAASWFNLGRALARQSHTSEAIVALRQSLELRPEHVPARLALARAYATLGQIDAAVSTFRKVLRLEPGNADAWFGLSSLNITTFDAADTAYLGRALARTDTPADQRELLGFALGKALEQQHDYGEAFEAFRQANASRQKRMQWDAAMTRRRMDAIWQIFNDTTLPPRPEPRLGHDVIFIVSFPRSGSTLVEHILASHPVVEGANEIRDMQQVIDAESRRRNAQFPQWVPTTSVDDWQRLGREYLQRTAHWHENKPWFTDKSLRTWPLAGAVLAMLPAAHVIVVRRNPVETCLGCFRQSFAEASDFPSELCDTADYYVDFLRLTQLWLEKYPDRVFKLDYETLVASPETTIRSLLDFCKLPFDPACLAFHQTSRTVLSLPSAALVRQPIRADTARSQCYGSKLDHLRQYLRDAGVDSAAGALSTASNDARA